MALLFLGPKEPTYKDKTIIAWLAQSEASTTFDVESEQAVHEIGTNAIPTLLRLLEANDGSIKWKCAAFLNRQKLFHTHFRTPYEKRGLAKRGFYLLGTNASTAVPRLLILIKHTDVGVRWDSMGCLLDILPKNEVVKSALLDLSKDSDAAVKQAATTLLNEYFPVNGGKNDSVLGLTHPQELVIDQTDFEMTNFHNLSLLVRYSEGESPGFPDTIQAVAASDLAPPGLAKPELFVCPATGHQAGSIKSISEWADYIYVGNLSDYMIGVALIICPPENHGGEFGYVVWNVTFKISRLPASQIRQLITNPFCMATNLSENIYKYGVTNVAVNIPDRLKKYYPQK